MFILCGVYICFFTVLACVVAKNICKSWFDYIYFEILQKIDVNNNSILFLSLFFFTIVPSHNCVWVDGAMTRCCDDDGAMTMTRWYEYCAGDGAKTQWWWCDRIMAMKRWSIAPSVLRHRTILISSSHHRAIGFLVHALFLTNWRQMWIFIKHTNVNKG